MKEEIAYVPKLSLPRHLAFSYHRSGWGYALEGLKPLLMPGGVMLDSFIEETFCWDLKENEQSGKLPYRQPWVAFIHNPPGIPQWHEYESAPQEIFKLPAWRESQAYCRGIFAFSQTMCSWLRQQIDVPVALAAHPTEIPDREFSMAAFLANSNRRIIQVGSWLRRLHSIARLQVKMKKALLSPRPEPDPRLRLLLQREAERDPAAAKADWSTVEFLGYHSPADYDCLLSNNIVFLDLYDTVVNNTIVECIVRRTPVACNRLSSLEELLGFDYPLFFSNLEEAAAKVDDPAVIAQAHEYLLQIPQSAFSQQAFRDSIAGSEIYRNL
jgi:hypothetical protein